MVTVMATATEATATTVITERRIETRTDNKVKWQRVRPEDICIRT
jgi:hypothetical protein